jgi:hypothetical protein
MVVLKVAFLYKRRLHGRSCAQGETRQKELRILWNFLEQSEHNGASRYEIYGLRRWSYIKGTDILLIQDFRLSWRVLVKWQPSASWQRFTVINLFQPLEGTYCCHHQGDWFCFRRILMLNHLPEPISVTLKMGKQQISPKRWSERFIPHDVKT